MKIEVFKEFKSVIKNEVLCERDEEFFSNLFFFKHVSTQIQDPLKTFTADNASKVKSKSKDLEAVREVTENWGEHITREQEGEPEEEATKSPRYDSTVFSFALFLLFTRGDFLY